MNELQVFLSEVWEVEWCDESAWSDAYLTLRVDGLEVTVFIPLTHRTRFRARLMEALTNE